MEFWCTSQVQSGLFYAMLPQKDHEMGTWAGMALLPGVPGRGCLRSLQRNRPILLSLSAPRGADIISLANICFFSLACAGLISRTWDYQCPKPTLSAQVERQPGDPVCFICSQSPCLGAKQIACSGPDTYECPKHPVGNRATSHCEFFDVLWSTWQMGVILLLSETSFFVFLLHFCSC